MRAVVFLSFLFFDLPNTQGRGGRSGAGATQRTGDQGTGAIQKKAGAWGMASGREMVASLGLEEKKNKDRTQSNQQQLNA